jgi:hypothetical protein
MIAVRNDRRRAVVLVGLFVALAAAVVMVGYVIWGGPDDKLSDRIAISGALLAIVAAVAPVVVWARDQRRREASTSTPAQVDAAADLLAVRTSATWSKELVRRGIEASAPVRSVGDGRATMSPCPSRSWPPPRYEPLILNRCPSVPPTGRVGVRF